MYVFTHMQEREGGRKREIQREKERVKEREREGKKEGEGVEGERDIFLVTQLHVEGF